MQPKVYIVVLNWNNAPDTIECLESLYRLRYSNYQVVLCDNASTDRSVEAILAWAEGFAEFEPQSHNPAIHPPGRPPLRKPLDYLVLDAATLPPPAPSRIPQLVVCKLPQNGGYAAGNNAGIRFAMERGDAAFVWILNNDTATEPGALEALVARCEADPTIGICGSLLLFYDCPDEVQAAAGATYRPITAIPRSLATGSTLSQVPSTPEVEARLFYVIGASMLVSRRFVDVVGLMKEDYFLYYEELDWAMRGKPLFKLGFARESIVYHKEGSSAGSSSNWRIRSEISDLCAVRSRLLFTRRHFPLFYPSVLATIAGSVLLRLVRRQPRRALQVLRIMLGPASFRLPGVHGPGPSP